jgi:hypothetical protein
MRLEGLSELKKSSDFSGNQTGDLPTCSIAPQPSTLLMTSLEFSIDISFQQRYGPGFD